MDQSYSECDVSLSPSQILDRLHMLRQLQLLQKGKLQKQQLQYHDSPEITSSITEIVSHFSNSTSYNTFRSLLQSSTEIAGETIPQIRKTDTNKDDFHNEIEGVSLLNLSQESESITNTPISSRSGAAVKVDSEKQHNVLDTEVREPSKKQILLDDIPILSPKKDFETLVKEKLSNEKDTLKVPSNNKEVQRSSKPFLRRGEGIARFGLGKNAFVIQNTKSLPWRKKGSSIKTQAKPKDVTPRNDYRKTPISVQAEVKDLREVSPLKKCSPPPLKHKLNLRTNSTLQQKLDNEIVKPVEKILSAPPPQSVSNASSESIINYPKGNHPLQAKKEKTWAAVFTKEQDDFLRQLKQSAYYKNFVSPAKSTISDISCSEQVSHLRQERENAEQNMFELIEHKVSNESFAMDNSFFNRFIGQKSNLECSGESTPLILQKCLYKNPNLMHIQPDIMQKRKTNDLCSDAETCDSECTECCDNSSIASSCCSCKTVTQNVSNVSCNPDTSKKGANKKGHQKNCKEEQKCHSDSVTATNEEMSANMAEMNAKLIATSELLKDRLKELEDEIETFRKENLNLSKLREEVDLERQKFYEEKSAFEQKFNEEKILSEYYLAEEKEKLNKQKQIYERYVRDMRGRLNKREKDEVANLKKEVLELKEEIRVKDAKSTGTIARLRNQIKIMDKEKKNVEEEVEKLKKENRRIQHSNEMTRRLTNIKYLEQINKKISNMVSKDNQSDVKLDSDIRYKAFEIERQSRSKKIQPVTKGTKKPRAKSVPNLNVTSRYAKYFSQKDSLSERDKNKTITDENFHTYSYASDNELSICDNENDLNDSKMSKINSDSEEENNLELIYEQRFKSISPTCKRSSTSTYVNSVDTSNDVEEPDDFFLKKTNSNLRQNTSNKVLSPSYEVGSYSSTSNATDTKSPTSSNRLSNYHLPDLSSLNRGISSNYHVNQNERHLTKSPVSILTGSSQKQGTVINKTMCLDTRMIPSPEPISSKTSLTKTNLNPIEIKKPDGSKELKFPNGNIKIISSDGKYSKFVYYNGDVKENFFNEGKIKYYYAETKTFHTTHPDGLEVLEFPDGQVEKRYKDGSSEIRLPNGSIRYFDPKNEHVREEWRFPDGATLTVSASGDQRIAFPNGQVEVHTKDHKRREFPDGTIKLIYNDGTSETRYASGRIRIKDKHGNLIMDSAPG